MKRDIKILISAIVALTLLGGCRESLPYSTGNFEPSLYNNVLSVTTRDFKFGNGVETKEGRIYTDYEWEFVDVASWLETTPGSGVSDSSFTLTTSANENATERTAIFYLTASAPDGKISRTMTATQAGMDPCIKFPEYEENTIVTNGRAHNLEIDVETNISDLAASFSETWGSARYDSANKAVILTLEENDLTETRMGSIELSSPEYSATAGITISQLAPDVTIIEGSSIEFGAEGGVAEKKIVSDKAWTAKTTATWIEFTPQSGEAGETTLKISALPSYDTNSRKGDIYIYFGETEKKYIEITQAGRYLNVSPTEILIPNEEGASEKINVESNVSWDVTSHPDWLTFDRTSGDGGNAVITISAGKNNSLNTRSGTIIIKDSETGSFESRVVVTQDGISFGDQSTLEFNWQSSQQPIIIPFTYTWNAKVSSGWISLSQYTGEGDEEVMVSVTQNDSEEVRTGSVTFESEEGSVSIAIIQQGQYLSISSTSGEISAKGGEIELTISSTIEVEATIEYLTEATDWITTEKVEDTYRIKADYNPSIMEREALLRLTPTDLEVSDKYSQGVTFHIKQYGRNLSCETSKIKVTVGGGTTPIYRISSDGTYTIEKDPNDDWYTVVPNISKNTFYLVVSENTTGAERQGQISISLTELPEGETFTRVVMVKQLTEGSTVNNNFTKEDFEEEEVW